MSIEYRHAKQNCFCRSCDKEMEKNKDKGIFLYSFRNCGQHISLCEKCVRKMYDKITKAHITQHKGYSKEEMEEISGK